MPFNRKKTATVRNVEFMMHIDFPLRTFSICAIKCSMKKATTKLFSLCPYIVQLAYIVKDKHSQLSENNEVHTKCILRNHVQMELKNANSPIIDYCFGKKTYYKFLQNIMLLKIYYWAIK
jgi:hypothetical protein